MKRIIDVDENLVCGGFVRNFTEKEKDVLINAIRYSIPYESKGEWIVIHNALGETKYQCNRCQHFVKPSDDKNFCPNCGARMGENKMTGYNELRDGQEFYANGYKKGYEDAKREYAQGKWTPISESLPEEKLFNPSGSDFGFDFDEVLCTTIWGDVRAYKFGKPKGHDKPHFWLGGGIMDEYVIAWQYKPEPYKEGGAE